MTCNQRELGPIGTYAESVMYDCHGCEVQNIVVEVVRRKPDQDIGDWLTTVVGTMVGDDHRTRSPLCNAKQFDLKIPLGKSAK